MKLKLFVLALIPLLFAGCLNDLFDEGDEEKTFEGPAQLEFKPLQTEFNLAQGQGAILVQLIGEQQDSDISVSFSVDGSSTAVEGTHYTLATPSPVTIESGTSSANVVINLIEDSLDGETVRLTLTLDDGNSIQPAENLKTSNIFITG
ncbi:MAG: DUF4843 domain-containing protein [Bacteroidetes bacterium]|jgi:hypothetical protein|nr:DUF4843 domain-containing protein [Bacteroidota bacterium]